MKIGDTAYFYEHWSDSIEKCQIEELKEIDGIKGAEVRSLGIIDLDGDIIGKSYGTSTRRIEDLYPSHIAAYNAYLKNCYDKTDKYMEEIKTIKDLIEFPLNHCLNGDEYTDYNAKRAYKQKVKELLGIDLDNENQLKDNDFER